MPRSRVDVPPAARQGDDRGGPVGVGRAGACFRFERQRGDRVDAVDGGRRRARPERPCQGQQGDVVIAGDRVVVRVERARSHRVAHARGFGGGERGRTGEHLHVRGGFALAGAGHAVGGRHDVRRVDDHPATEEPGGRRTGARVIQRNLKRKARYRGCFSADDACFRARPGRGDGSLRATPGPGRAHERGTHAAPGRLGPTAKGTSHPGDPHEARQGAHRHKRESRLTRGYEALQRNTDPSDDYVSSLQLRIRYDVLH